MAAKSPLDWYYNKYLTGIEAQKPQNVKSAIDAWASGGNPLKDNYTGLLQSGNLDSLNPGAMLRNGIAYGSGFASDDNRNFSSADDALWALGIDRNASRDAINWQLSQILDPSSAWATRTSLGLDFTTPDFAPFRERYGTDPAKLDDARLSELLGALGAAGIESNKYIKETKAADNSFGNIFGRMLLAASPGLFGAGIAGFPGLGLTGGNPLSGISDGIRGLLGGSPNANAVPGLSTGVTTPTGGGLVGAGALNPAGVGLVGGAPLGASPLAVAGGAAALPGVSPLPTGGQIPGTNINVGTPGDQSWLDRIAQNVRENVTDPKSLAQRVATNLIGNALSPEQAAASGGGMGNPGQAFASQPWPDSLYPGEVPHIPGYLPGLLAMMQTRRGLLG